MIDKNKPIYITFYCSGEHCNKEFNLIVKNKEFGDIRFNLVKYNKRNILVCCPYCDHYQYLTIVDFLQMDSDRYFAL